MSEQLSNRTLLRLLCRSDQSADLIADRIEELQRKNAALRSLLRESLDYIDQYDYEEAFDMVQRIKAALGGHK